MKKTIIQTIIICVSALLFTALCCLAEESPHNICLLRQLSFKERREPNLIPYTTDVAQFKGYIRGWLATNRLHERYGRWQLLKDGRGHVRVKVREYGPDNIERVEVNIIPNKRREIADYGGYEYGIECSEGVWALYNALHNSGYDVHIKRGIAGLWKHVVVSALIDGNWINISTTPDIDSLDFEISGLEDISPALAERDFGSYSSNIDISEAARPMARFVSSERNSAAIAATVIPHR